MARKIVKRASARVVLVDPRDRVLLLHFDDHSASPRKSYWLTPGGGVRRWERLRRAAARELREETGYVLAAGRLGPAVAVSSGPVVFGGVPHHCTDTYFFARVREQAVDPSGLEDHERSLITEYRWWSVAELRGTRDLIIPPSLADLLERVLTGGRPAAPLRLPWHH